MAKVNPRYRLALNKELKRCLTHWFSVKPVHITQYLNASVRYFMFVEGGSNTDADSQLLTSQHLSPPASARAHQEKPALLFCRNLDFNYFQCTLTEISNVHRKVPKTTLSNKNPFEILTSKMERVGKTSTPEFIFNNYLVTF